MDSFLIEIEQGSYDNSCCPSCSKSGITYDQQEPVGTGFTSTGNAFSSTLFTGTCRYCRESYYDVIINVSEKNERPSSLVIYYRGGNNNVPLRWLAKAEPDATMHYLGPFMTVSTLYGPDGVVKKEVACNPKEQAASLVFSVVSVLCLNIDPDKDNCGPADAGFEWIENGNPLTSPKSSR